MPSILARSTSQSPAATNGTAKKKFRTIVGFSPVASDNSDATEIKRKQSREPSDVTNAAFFTPADQPLLSPISIKEQMKPDSTPNTPTRTLSRKARPVRMGAQDGPWSVSVAETPNDKSSYSIYIKTPTHHLTLTRTANEIADLHAKLHDAHPNSPLPTFPLENIPPKRRSSFLQTLSRFATSNRPQPLTSPAAEASDPFLSAHPTLASYLTSLSNDPTFRLARAWKRFVRVRTDDLESVRVERPLKRVRSDLAMHAAVPVQPAPATASGSGSVGIAEEEEGSNVVNEQTESAVAMILADDTPRPSVEPESPTKKAAAIPLPTPSASPAPPAPTELKSETPAEVAPEAPAEEPSDVPADVPTDVPTEEETEPPAPTHAPRIPRSASADPSKRHSRLRKPSPLGAQDTDAEDSEATQDASSAASVKGSGKRRKKKLERKSRKVVVDDFEMMRVLGKGCAGKVLLVRHRATTGLYALKAITKRHVLAHQELQHTLTEQAVLKRMAREAKDPFVVKLWWSFHDKENLFLVMDFHPGGDLATQLARWGRLGRDRARFYAAEIVEGVQGLHGAGVIYRDLKPENILIGGDGHIVLTDFGLSKEFPRRSGLDTPSTTDSPSASSGSDFYSSIPASPAVTPNWMSGSNGSAEWPVLSKSDLTSTFCGTAEYLAPEVIQGLPYSYEVDWWSFGTMLYEMLTGITPFWANNHSDMYVRVLQDELTFPDDKAMDQDTKSLIRGLLQRNPALRMSEPRVKRHPYFSMIDWSHVYHKRYIPPYIPPIDPSNASDTQNFDDTFLDMEPIIDNEPDPQTDSEKTDGEKTDGDDSAKSSTAQPSVEQPPVDETVDVFDGYSFKGRDSIIIDDDGYDGPDEDEEEDVTRLATALEEEPEEPKTPGASSPPTPVPPEVVLARESPKVVKVQELPPEEPVSEKPAEVVKEVAPPTDSPASRLDKELPPAPKEEAPKSIPAPPQPATKPRSRREKSGIPALDRHIPDIDEDDETHTEREDDDWDLVEAPGAEEMNGTKGASLFARGVVDRYRLQIWRKAAPRPTPRANSSANTSNIEPDFGPATTPSPSPSDKVRRGRSAGLSLRKSTKQFLRAKSPATFSGATSRIAAAAFSNNSSFTAAGTAASSTTIIDGMPSVTSLKSKPSTTSVGSPSSSNTSVNGDTSRVSQSAADLASPTKANGTMTDLVSVSSHGGGKAATATGTTKNPPATPDVKNGKKPKKPAAEKMFSLFSSPRQQ